MTRDASATRPAADAGFSLIEMLIATTLLLLVTGTILTLANPAGGAYAARSEATDLEQRLRVGVDVMRRALLMAGAGTYVGAEATPLVYIFAPILPHTVGTLMPGSPDRPDPATITIMYVPLTAAQTTTRTDLTSEAVDLKVNLRPGCPVGDLLCGFSQGMRVLVFDALGAYDVFTVMSVQGDAMRVQHRDARFTTTYPAGAYITEVVSRTFYLDASERRLYSYDGYRSALPILDNVVALRFDYFGEPSPPALRPSTAGPAAPKTTYGPRPPPAGADSVNDDWAAGENCAFALSGAAQAGRLADWRSEGGVGGLVPIPYTQLSDGPWCPGMTNASGAMLPNRFDADMLRVRRVRVTLRVQVGSETLRGTNPVGQALFVHPGTARQAEGWVPDEAVTFEVTPRNMNVGR